MTILDEEQEYFISWAKGVVGEDSVLEKEPHGDEGVVYKLQTPSGNYYLKLKKGSDFSSERQRLDWLQNKLPVPKVVASTQKNGVGALLLTAIEGRNLAALCKEWSAEKVIDQLVQALKHFHAADPANWPFEEHEDGMVLVHSDACLPNFIFTEENFSGYVDLGESALGPVEIDLRAAVWSLQYNLGAGHGLDFLRKYGYQNATEKQIMEFIHEYEDLQRAHSLL
ncbi:MAG: aminoglycoside 3-phosphotransferase [Patescibacteria group bacterium]|nr:aminoglycoside 3-phosphotransferase [Patescibacteria group bacterium]